MRSSSPTFGRQNKRKTFSRRGVTFGTFPLHPLWIHQTWSPVLIAAVSSVKVPLNDIFPNVPTCATTRLPRRKHKSPESVADTRTASLLISSGRPIFHSLCPDHSSIYIVGAKSVVRPFVYLIVILILKVRILFLPCSVCICLWIENIIAGVVLYFLLFETELDCCFL